MPAFSPDSTPTGGSRSTDESTNARGYLAPADVADTVLRPPDGQSRLNRPDAGPSPENDNCRIKL